jgi:hypothetical protein
LPPAKGGFSRADHRSGLACFATSAVADNLVINDPSIQYAYTYQKLGARHFCDLATVMAKAPIVIKLTAAFVTDEAKPKDRNLTVAYMVEAFVVCAARGAPLESKQFKIIAGRIVSDIFHSDLHATKNVDRDLGVSYNIPSEGSLALFTNLMTLHGAYSLAIELENHSTMLVKVNPTADILDASEKWTKCSVAIMRGRNPQ